MLKILQPLTLLCSVLLISGCSSRYVQCIDGWGEVVDRHADVVYDAKGTLVPGRHSLDDQFIVHIVQQLKAFQQAGRP